MADKKLTPKLFLDLAIENEFRPFEYPDAFKLYPEIYLLSAEKDLNEKSSHGDLNSVFNSKKAVHCQIDMILWNLGFFEFHKSNFPRKLQILDDCGVIAPGILSKLNHIRNFLEHEYQDVERKDAQELYDIALLFEKATNNYHSEIEFVTDKYFEGDFGGEMEEVEVIENQGKKKIKMYLPSGRIFLDREKQNVVVEYNYSDNRQLRKLSKVIKKNDYDDYRSWVSFLMRIQKI